MPVIRFLLVWLSLLACSPGKRSPVAEGTHRVSIHGAGLVYHVHGHGPVMLAIAGGPGSSWNYLRMTGVEQYATIVYVELVGTGDSARLADPKQYSRERDVSDVEGFRAYLGIDKVIVLGHSYGGNVALEYALAHPEHLAGLVLYDTSPVMNEEWGADVEKNMATYEKEPWFADAHEAWKLLDGQHDDATLKALFLRISRFYVHAYSAQQARWEKFFADARLDSDRNERGTVTPFDVRPLLSSIRAPTLVLVGAHDFICGPKFASMSHDGISGSQLVRFENSGHLAHVEEPARFVAALAAFIQSRDQPRRDHHAQ